MRCADDIDDAEVKEVKSHDARNAIDALCRFTLDLVSADRTD